MGTKIITKIIMTAVNIAIIAFLFPLLMNKLFDTTVTETRTKIDKIDSGISYVEKVTKNKTTYQAEVQISSDEAVTADVSKEMFSRQPEQAILIQCQLDKPFSDSEKVILTDDENYDTTTIQKKLIEDGEKDTWHIAIAMASLLFVVGVFILLLEFENSRQ